MDKSEIDSVVCDLGSESFVCKVKRKDGSITTTKPRIEGTKVNINFDSI